MTGDEFGSFCSSAIALSRVALVAGSPSIVVVSCRENWLSDSDSVGPGADIGGKSATAAFPRPLPLPLLRGAPRAVLGGIVTSQWP